MADPKTTLPRPFSIEEAADKIVEYHTANKGSSFSPYFGNLAGQKLHAVSIFNERVMARKGDHVSADDLRTFIRNNADLLADPRVGIGTWYEPEEGKTYIDVVLLVTSGGQEAARLGTRYDQIGMFDLENGKYIITGGQGRESVPGLPPIEKRLPRLGRPPRREKK